MGGNPMVRGIPDSASSENRKLAQATRLFWIKSPKLKTDILFSKDSKLETDQDNKDWLINRDPIKYVKRVIPHVADRPIATSNIPIEWRNSYPISFRILFSKNNPIEPNPAIIIPKNRKAWKNSG